MDIYKDMLLKMKFHKENIIKSFIKKGYYPKEDEIGEKMAQLDHRLALFEAYINVPGTKMNVKELNYCFEMIAKDIEFLYKVIKEINDIDLSRAKLFVEAHLTELENIAEYYKKRNDVEVNTTTLGNTLFFAAGNWKVETENNLNKIDLGEVELLQGTKIACFANVNNAISNTVKFVFDHNDSNYKFEALPYNYNNDTYIVPGELKVNITDASIGDDVKISENNEVPINIKTSVYNDYFVLGGLNKMTVTYKDTGFTEILDIPTDGYSFLAKKGCYISFYFVDGDEIEYKFNKKPIHTNFSMHSGIIKTTSDMHKVFIDADKGFTCEFTFSRDGNVWAFSKEAIVGGPSYILYNSYGTTDYIKDFQVREYVKENKTKYKLTAYMESNEDTDLVIDSIYIKEV